MSILVVDDYHSMVKLTRAFLAELGYANVDDSRDVNSALEKISGKRIALVIADWSLEPLSGMDLLRAVRAMPSCDQTRFIMVTAESRTDRLMAARRAGADHCLIKPFNAAALKTKIERVFGA